MGSVSSSFAFATFLSVFVVVGPLAAASGSPPSQPWGLVAVSWNDRVHLTWQAPLEDGALPILEYRVYRADPLGTFGLVGAAASTQFTDTIAATSPIAYYVTAVNANGESPPSPIAATLAQNALTIRAPSKLSTIFSQYSGPSCIDIGPEWPFIDIHVACLLP